MGNFFRGGNWSNTILIYMDSFSNFIYKIRDSIDVYLSSKDVIIFYFSNTKKVIEFRTSENTIYLLSLINGFRTIEEIVKLYNEKYIDRKIEETSIIKVFKFLVSKNILYLANHNNINDYRYDRQISYLSEFYQTHNQSVIQDKLLNSHVTIFGVGAIGGNIALLLAMAGVQNFTLIDYKKISKDSLVRHSYYRDEYIGLYKTEAIKREILKINNNINIKSIPIFINYDTDISDYIDNSDFIINSADYPYIGYTSIKISREAIKKNKPHYIAGGFDLHLLSTGELIIPGVTPCADCYKSYFRTALKDWNPEKKNIHYVDNEMGGFSSQSLFSASFASIQIIKFLCSIDSGLHISRGEMNIENYQIDYLNIKRDENCPICGKH